MTSLRSKTYIKIIYYLISGWTFLLHSVADFMNDSTKFKGTIYLFIHYITVKYPNGKYDWY